MASGNLIWIFIICGIIVLATAAAVILRAVRHDEDDAFLPEAPPEPAPAPATPRPAAPRPDASGSAAARPELRAETLRPTPVRPPRPEEKQLFRYAGKRADWWVCPNCACENDPDRTHCRVCLWDRSVEVK